MHPNSFHLVPLYPPLIPAMPPNENIKQQQTPLILFLSCLAHISSFVLVALGGGSQSTYSIAFGLLQEKATC